MTTKNKTLVSANIPFSGFYESWHDAEFDSCMERIFDVEGNGASWAAELSARFFDSIDLQGAQIDYAKAYAANFAEALGMTVFEWEEMVSPREYNVTTDRLFAKFDLSELAALFARSDIRIELDKVAAEMFTSRSGFISFYSPDVTSWPEFQEWDANQFGALLKAAANVVIADGGEFNQEKEFGLMERSLANGLIDDCLWGNTSDNAVIGNRCDKVARYLAKRASR